MARPRNPRVGEFLEIRQTRNGQAEWLPLLVTHVHDMHSVSGVAFNGEQGTLGWGSGVAKPFLGVRRGEGVGEWRMSNGKDG